MAELNARPKRGFKGQLDAIINFLKNHFLAVNFFVVGVTGSVACSIFVEDDEWIITSVSYLSALAACSVVCIVCKRGNLFYKNIEHNVKGRFQTSKNQRSTSQSIPEFNRLRDNEVLPLLSSQHGSFVVNDNPAFRESNPLEDAFENIREPHSGSEGSNADICEQDNQSNVIVADVHQPRGDSERISLKSASPEENESSSSNAVGSDPQDSRSIPDDSGIAVQSSAQSLQPSGEEERRPPTPEPQH